MRFRKIHGAGNDFVLITDPESRDTSVWAELAERLCTRQTGVGADGLVFSHPSDEDPEVLEVTYFNSNGLLATMCGNALRCAAWAAHDDSRGAKKEMKLRMAGVMHEAIVDADSVWVTAEVNAIELRRLQIVVNGQPTWFDSVHTGTEHVVAIVSDVAAVEAEAVGRIVRHHHRVAPLGTNVNFVQHLGDQALKVRTYERGVEAETLSCGSGAVAAVVVATVRGLVAKRAVTVHNESGDPLVVRPHTHRPHRAAWLGGPVTHTFSGVIA
ncbi:diaminopimelate epimerase [Streptomyces sp. NPDC048290]|uniref:diaminopimelate epimerase n=1 Tax=Streptomyces sp. NPDC048290 TaxID=3155811 RepID=UPI00341775F8